MARELHPGKRNSLDALCERYGVDNAHRTLHGALLDARLLAEVYLAMTRGQESLVMDLETPAERRRRPRASTPRSWWCCAPRAEELKAHEKYLDGLAKEAGGKVLWRRCLGSGCLPAAGAAGARRAAEAVARGDDAAALPGGLVEVADVRAPPGSSISRSSIWLKSQS